MIVMCAQCGAKNRVSDALAPHLRPRCGRCGAALDAADSAAGSAPIDVTDDTLNQVLQQAGEKPVLVDCWAEWCPPCRMLAPVIDQLAAEAAERWVIAKLDVDSNPRTAAQFRIEGIPALLLFKRGQLVEQLVGLQPKQAIADALAKHL